MWALSHGLKDKLDIIDAELNDVAPRLFRLYDVLETGKIDLIRPEFRWKRTRYCRE